MENPMMLRKTLLVGTAIGALASTACLPARAAPLKVGSDNVAVIEPPVMHPHETPCAVPLITDVQFVNYNAQPYSFTPPASCPGPWAKVVLAIDLSLNAGIQYDRSGMLYMAGVPLWFGTTAEPSPNLAPRWHFEKDVTDYTALFEAAQTGSVSIGNTVNSTYTGIITSTMTLYFYPATPRSPAPVTADVVLPIPGTGGSGTLSGPTDTIATTAVFPTNIVRAKMDLYLQGQIGDEFWYTCVPNSLSSQLESCGGGPLREGEVTVDSTPAGVAPVYPWIFTGGIDPYLWQPIPGVQTLDFTPFQVDLSPFAGVLSNGAQHTIAASVYGANNYFVGTGAIRLFLDHGASTVTGAITRNTLVATPDVVMSNTISSGGSATTGTVSTSDKRNFTIEGYVRGSAGVTHNVVQQTTTYKNNQSFDITASAYVQKIHQETDTSLTSTSDTGGVQTVTTTALQWPLYVAYKELFAANGDGKQISSISQQYLKQVVQTVGNAAPTTFNITNTIQTGDSLLFSNQGYITGNKNQSETAYYLRNGSDTTCFQRTLAAQANMLTAVQTGC
jgi:hypothetical protein